MPTGYPKDPEAAKAKREANKRIKVTDASLDALRAKLTGQPVVKRSHTKKTTLGTVNLGQEIADRDQSIRELEAECDASREDVRALEADLSMLQERYGKVVDAMTKWQDTSADLQKRLFTVLDLVANQK